MRKITKITIKRAVRTFFQTFFGTAITIGSTIDWLNLDIKQSILSILLSSLFAALAAIGMNMESVE